MTRLSKQLAATIMARTPKLERDQPQDANWTYASGVVLKGFEALWRRDHDARYLDYIEANISPFVQPDGDILSYSEAKYNLDLVNTGRLFYLMKDQTQEQRYELAIQRLRHQLAHQPRTSGGSFWHKQVYPYQVWLDGVYMALPFYTEYCNRYQDQAGYADILNQFDEAFSHLYAPQPQLLYHAWDEKHVQPWADPKTGCSPHFWTRSIGWYVMAIVDVIALLQDTDVDVTPLKHQLTQLLSGLVRAQDPASGTWYQVTDAGDRVGNYLEASGSSMVIYAIARGISLGLLDRKQWFGQLMKSYTGLQQQFVTVTKNGWLNLNKNCKVAGLGGSPRRDGSFAYYISEPIVTNDSKGVGAFLQACVAVEALLPE